MARAARGGRKEITPETGISGSFKGTEYKEQGGGYDGPPPPRGLYPAKLSSVGAHTTSDTSIVWTFDITDGKYAGWRGWVYSDMDNSKWKTQNILVALGVIEPEAEINKSYEQIMKEAEPCRVQIIVEDYQDELRSKVKNVLVAGSATADAEDEADPDFDDEAESAPAPKASRRSRGAKAEPPPATDGSEDDDAREAREEELAELSLADVKKVAKDAGFKLADYRGKEPGEIIEMILDKEFPEDDEAEEKKGLDLDELEEELEDMTLADLKKKAKDFGLKVADIRGKDEEELIDLIMDAAEEQNPSF